MRPDSSALVLALALALAPAAASAGPVADGVLAEINFARTQPQAYARQRLAQPAAYDRWGHGDRPLADDPEAIEEAIEVMMRQRPLPPLQWDTRLADAAREHVRGQGASGQMGHAGRGGLTPGERMQQAGVFAGITAEDISYGYEDPRNVVLQLIIDSGVASRGHRQNILSRSLQKAGVACGEHRAWGSMCVIDFAGAIVQR
jgi:uncharacterized protein YkwD